MSVDLGLMTIEPSLNLLIIHTTGAEALSDWTTVQEKIAKLAPDIDVRIVNNSAIRFIPRAWLVSRPLLVLAPYVLRRPWLRGGKLHTGMDYDKFVQLQRLAAAGLPVPPTKRLSEFSPAAVNDWGKFVIVKPIKARLGQGVRLLPASDLAKFAETIAPSQRHEVLVQPYIDHADMAGRPFDFRVFTFFGRLIYSSRNSWPVARAPLEQIAASDRGLIASNSTAPGRRTRTLTGDRDVIELGLAAARAFPELPVTAVDIIRDRNSRKLFILEVNPRGESWHLSSDFAIERFDPAHRAALYTQNDALDVVADALIEKTRSEAC